MKIKIRKFIYVCCYYLGIIHLFYFINRKKQRILVFHHIIPDKYLTGNFEQDIVCTSYSKFAWIMSIVNKRFKVTTNLSEPNSAVITFDDGYRTALVANEVLEKWNNKAYFFIPLTNVGAGPLWIDQLMAWFAYVPKGVYRIGNFQVTLSDNNSRHTAFDSAINSLYENYDKVTLIELLDKQYPYKKLSIDKDYFELRFKGLREEEINSLKNSGHIFGGHSINHDVLSLLDAKSLYKDFEECSQQVGILFNTSLYAYPYGHKRDVTQNVIQACRMSSFTHAVINEHNSKATNYSLSRLNISHYNSRYEIEASLSGLIQAIKTLLNRITQIRMHVIHIFSL